MEPDSGPPSGPSVTVLAALFLGVSTAVFVTLTLSAGFSYEPLDSRQSGQPASGPAELAELETEHRQLAAAARRRIPRDRYIVIDRGNNRLYVRDGEEVVLDAVVSTGSGTILREIGGQGRTWIFDTPPGRHEVRGLRTNPVWTKPDWAFLEEGLPLPTTIEQRFESGVLGEYALNLGGGYLIHGTLYERLLGRSVTHGCVRVGRDDLRGLVGATGLGTDVYIF